MLHGKVKLTERRMKEDQCMQKRCEGPTIREPIQGRGRQTFPILKPHVLREKISQKQDGPEIQVVYEGGSGGFQVDPPKPLKVPEGDHTSPGSFTFESKKLISKEEATDLIVDEDKKRFKPLLSSNESNKRPMSFKVKRKMTTDDNKDTAGYFEQNEFLSSLMSDKDFGKFDMLLGKSGCSFQSKGSDEYGNISIDQDSELPLQLETQFNKLMDISRARFDEQESDDELENKKVLDEGKKMVHQIRKSRMNVRLSGQLSSQKEPLGTTSKLLESKGFNTSIDGVQGTERSLDHRTPTSNLGLNSPFDQQSTVKSRVSGAERGLCSDYTINSIEGLSEARLETSAQPSPTVENYDQDKRLKRQSFKEMIGSVKVEGFQIDGGNQNKSGRQDISDHGGSDFFDQGSFLNMRGNDSELLDQSTGFIPNHDQAVYGLQMISKNQ